MWARINVHKAVAGIVDTAEKISLVYIEFDWQVSSITLLTTL
jgi:hypothetical protein